MRFRLTKNDDADIGFALACLLAGTIHFREFKEWLYFVIEHAEEPPNYIFDMLDVKQRVDFKPIRNMGWHAGSTLTDDELDMLTGIGFRRGISDFEDRVSRAEAIRKLDADDVFFARVKEFFPFLDLDKEVGPDPDKGW